MIVTYKTIYRTSQLQTINLSKQPIAVHQAGPLSDIFILKFGLEYLNLSNCKLEDEVKKKRNQDFFFHMKNTQNNI